MRKNWTITRNQFLTLAEIQKLYSVLKDAKDLALHRRTHYCHVRDYYILHVLLESGLRCFELTALTVGNIRNGSLVVERGKCGKKRNVLLTKSTQKLLNEFLRIKARVLKEPVTDDSPLFLNERRKHYSTGAIRSRTKLWFKRCGFSSTLSCHSTRHSYASHLISQTKDLILARDNLGHSSLSVTSIYSHLTKDCLEDLELYY